ncbi:MAG: hypothetical protein C4304_03490 [candidate division GAL15 bacterium]
MRELDFLDRRSRRTLLLSGATLRRHRDVVDRWVEEGYGLTLVPRLELLGTSASAHTWVQALCDTVEEMVRHQHTVVALRAAEDPDLDKVLQALAQRQVKIPVRPCTSGKEADP